ncbi:hypothetical protein HNR40_000744 [Nonomuraea endophytica]|uniref:Uncharacterized protein n=1 Tax=Nonomuraea endophytica TaxID=714136 RepID=A0A7W7ZWY4_9ACTN|nr:hypothetical protein [Nonomuraea endophytica]
MNIYLASGGADVMVLLPNVAAKTATARLQEVLTGS